MIQESSKAQQLTDEESESLLSNDDKNNGQTINKQKSNIQEKDRDHQVMFEKMCIFFVIGALCVVLLIICGILISTFKAQEIQRQLLDQKSFPLIVPLVDLKQYRSILLQNKLKVLLITDKDADSSAVAIDVNAGSWQEPENINGLAHFLEHMLFLANEKYNETGALDKFLSLNGGFSNAYTTDIHTNFYAKVKPGAFLATLDMFAQMSQGSKEAQNVQSEFQIDVGQDSWMLQNFVSLICKPDHPMSRFTVGTVDTLINQPLLEEIDVFDALKDFFDTHYSSNVMGLVLYSNHDLDTLESYVEKANFKAIKNKEVLPTSMKKFGSPIEEDNLQSIYKLQITSESNSLEIIIQIDSQQNHYKKRALEYIEFMLTYPGKNGYLDLMIQQDQGIVHDNDEFTLIQISLILTPLGLKVPGTILKSFYSYLDKVLKTGIKQDYYEQLKAISQNKFNYNPDDNTEIYETISQIANYLNTYQQQEVIQKIQKIYQKVLESDYIFEEYDQQYISSVLQQILNTSNAFYVMCSNTLFNDGESVEFLQNDLIGMKTEFRNPENQFYNELYDIKYSQVKLTEDDLMQLNMVDENFFQFFQMIQLPQLNHYVPENMELITLCNDKDMNIDASQLLLDDILSDDGDQENIDKFADYESMSRLYLQKFIYQRYENFNKNDECEKMQYIYEKKHHYPQIIGKNLYYKLERKYRAPTITYIIQMSSTLPLQSVKNQTLNKILEIIISQDLQRNLADPLSADYNFDVTSNLDGLTLTLSGWSDKFNTFADLFFTYFRNMEIKEDTFELAKEVVQINYIDQYETDTLHQAYTNVLANLIQNPYFEYSDCIEQVQMVQLQDAIDYHQQFLEQMTVTQYISGNIDPKSAQNLALNTIQKFSYNNIDDNSIQIYNFVGKFQFQSINSLKGQSFVHRSQVIAQDDNENSVIINYYQVGKRNVKSYVLQLLLEDILNSFEYGYLRTDRNLGYVAFAQMVRHNCIDGFVIGIIQSKQSLLGVEGSTESPDIIDETIEESLFAFEEYLNNFQDEDFQSIQESVEIKLKQPFLNLGLQSAHYFEFTQYKIPVFDQNELALDILDQIQLSDLQNAFQDIFKDNVGKLSVQIYSKVSGFFIDEETMDLQQTYGQIQPVLLSQKSQLDEDSYFTCKMK